MNYFINNQINNFLFLVCSFVLITQNLIELKAENHTNMENNCTITERKHWLIFI